MLHQEFQEGALFQLRELPEFEMLHKLLLLPGKKGKGEDSPQARDGLLKEELDSSYGKRSR